MNTSFNQSKGRIFPRIKPSLQDHIEQEHETIRKELHQLRALVCTDYSKQRKNEEIEAEIEFRNLLIWISRIMKAHMTSEERVVFKRAYPAMSAEERVEIEKVCDVNGSIDMVLDDLESRSWESIEAIRFKVFLLIDLFENHVSYEEDRLLGSLKVIPRCSQKSLIRQFVLSENEFLAWLNQVECNTLPV